MAKILFVPICSKCEKIIFRTVDFKKPVWSLEINDYRLGSSGTVEPEECPNCGAKLESIIMPQHIPFNMNMI